MLCIILLYFVILPGFRGSYLLNQINTVWSGKKQLIHSFMWLNCFFPLQSIFILFIHFFIPNSCNNNKIETIFKEYMLQYIFLLAPNYNYLLYKQIELTNKFKQVVVKEKCG